jgi:hypothetical protein
MMIGGEHEYGMVIGLLLVSACGSSKSWSLSAPPTVRDEHTPQHCASDHHGGDEPQAAEVSKYGYIDLSIWTKVLMRRGLIGKKTGNRMAGVRIFNNYSERDRR